MRADRLANLAERIQQGGYYIPEADVANAILRRHANESRGPVAVATPANQDSTLRETPSLENRMEMRRMPVLGPLGRALGAVSVSGTAGGG